MYQLDHCTWSENLGFFVVVARHCLLVEGLVLLLALLVGFVEAAPLWQRDSSALKT